MVDVGEGTDGVGDNPVDCRRAHEDRGHIVGQARPWQHHPREQGALGEYPRVLEHHHQRVEEDDQAGDKVPLCLREEEVGVDHGEYIERVSDPLAPSCQVDEEGDQDGLSDEIGGVYPVERSLSLLALDQVLKRECEPKPGQGRVEQGVEPADASDGHHYQCDSDEGSESDPAGEDRLEDRALQLRECSLLLHHYLSYFNCGGRTILPKFFS